MTAARGGARDNYREPAQMSHVVERNIEALAEVRAQEERRRSASERIAGQITRFAGSMWSVYVHLVLYGGWLIINLGAVPGIKPWDPLLVQLAMAASVEAIFLSMFILISQNRMQLQADRRAELDLQISLLTEHELTRAIHMLDAISQKLQVSAPVNGELEEIKRDVSPARVAEAINAAEADNETTVTE